MRSCVYWFVFFVLWNCNKALDKIKIGGIFDSSSIYALTAFRHEVHKINRDLPFGSHGFRYQLHNDTSIVDITDSFSVMNALCHHLSRGDLAIVGVSNSSSLPVIQSYSDAFRVPYVSISTTPNRRQNDTFQIYMRPIYTNALVDVMKFYNWEKVTFFYDSDEGLIRLQQLFQAINQYVHLIITIDTRRISTAHDGYLILRELHTDDPDAHHTILLDFQTSKAEQIILKVYNDTAINNARFHFLLGDLGILEMDLSAFVNGGVNITGFQLVDPYHQNSEIFMLRWQNLDKNLWPGAGSYHVNYEAALSSDAISVFHRAFGSILKEEPHFLMSLRRNRYSSNKTPMKCTDDSDVTTRHGKKILKAMKKVNFQGITGHVAFDESGHRKDFTLDLYTVEMFRGTAKVGYWSQKEKRIHIQQPKLFRHQNNSAQNRTRIITTILKEPYVMIKKKPENGLPFVGVENLEGFCIDLARLVQEKVGFDFIIKFVGDDSYGELLPNGTWDGMVGELIRHEADMAIASFTITADRSRVIDFTKPFMTLGISIMIQRPNPTEKPFFSFMDPLSYEIWMCIVFAYIGVSVVLFLVSRFSPKEWHVTETEHDIANDFSISNSLWFSLGALMQQGCDISPRSVSGRIVGSVWWFFTLIIISSYTANLAAFLTVERMLTPINSAEDLAKQTEIQYGTIMSGATKSFFKNSQYQTYKRMWAFMSSAQPTVFVQKHEDGIERVRNSSGKYAYITESTTIEYISNKKPCDTLKVGNNLNSNGFGIATPLGSDLRHQLNFAVLNLTENGVLAKLQTKWFDGGDCAKGNSNLDGGQSALSLDNVAGIFYLLVGGLIIAICSAGIELLYKARVESSHSKMSFGCTLRSKARLSFRRRVDKDSNTLSHVQRRPHHSVTYTYTRPTNVCGVKHDFETPDNHTEV